MIEEKFNSSCGSINCALQVLMYRGLYRLSETSVLWGEDSPLSGVR